MSEPGAVKGAPLDPFFSHFDTPFSRKNRLHQGLTPPPTPAWQIHGFEVFFSQLIWESNNLLEQIDYIDVDLIQLFCSGGALADLGGAPGARPPTGPDSFVLTCKIFET